MNDLIFDEDYTTPMDITKLSTVYAMKTGDALEEVTDSNGDPETGVYANYRVVLSLYAVAVAAAEETELFFCFDALGDSFHMQSVSESEDAFEDDPFLFIFAVVTEE